MTEAMTEAELRQALNAMIGEGIVDATRIGLGHAIMTIQEYAGEHADSAPHCAALVATLRRHSAMLADTAAPNPPQRPTEGY